jgi:hypothetical protein
MKSFLFTSLTAVLFMSGAFANSQLNHLMGFKERLRTSLWYEGINREDASKAVSQSSSVILPVELEVALIGLERSNSL